MYSGLRKPLFTPASSIAPTAFCSRPPLRTLNIVGIKGGNKPVSKALHPPPASHPPPSAAARPCGH